MNRFVSRKLVAAALTGAALGAVSAAQAHSEFSFSVGVPVAPVYVEPAPVYVQPPPVFVETRPVYIAPRAVYIAPRPAYGPPPGYVVDPAWRPYRGWEHAREREWRRREWKRHHHRSHDGHDRGWD